ncbi:MULTISPECIES: TRAP transporter large permease [unclassified Simplicispira]|uniref:TRAP transporter large permease n=1 Tax=unclassified Simplicispira TaxID=2630407 RepID=UPI000D5EEDD3|nr:MULTISPECIES: TRAP transporter large permease subunit [unclassified Simplicispira]MBH1979479.1 TRAP transporter large permease subunit [Comamonadaceae bacterium]PVY57172.1 tripartite ATP-independent transporter DctM subunit [Simplicispira sp. 125]REG18117.1 tripartite ATP-independent transporter DctM subunit [Simplicispira sp. 110]
MSAAIFLGALLSLIALGMPIAFALLLSGVAVMFQMGQFDSQIVVQNAIGGADNFVLMAVPFFILAGEFMNAGGLSRRIVEMAGAFVGHLRGGLGYVAIFAAILLASLSGSAVADTAALAAILVPMMRQAGYDPARACGLMAAGGIIAPVIPPSIGFLLFGVVANVSITRLFLAGIVPGVMMGGALVVAWWLVSRRTSVLVAPRKPWKERLALLGKGFWALMLPVIIIGGLKFGIFTPTEAAVVAAVYALFVGAVIYRELTMAAMYHCLLVTARTTAVVLLLAALAMVASYMITIADVPGQVGGWLGGLSEHPLALTAAMMAVVFLAGMVLDFIPIVLIFTPVFLPIVQQAGIDPVYFGVIFIINCSLGMITPPVGVVLNVVSSIGKVTLGQAARGVLPFLMAELAVLVALVLWPALVMVPASWWR